MLSLLTGKSAERALFRKSVEEEQDTCISLTIHQINTAKTLGDQLTLGPQKIFRAMIAGRVVSISHSKSPKGIDITELTVKDDTGILIVSAYHNEFPSDVLTNLLSGAGMK